MNRGLPAVCTVRTASTDQWRRPVINLKPACHRMIGVLAGVTDDQLTSSSPCTEYTVGDLIDHVDQVSQGATALARRAAELAGPDAVHLESDWRDRVAQHVLEVGEAWGKITLTELVVHGWDIAKATGQPFDLPEHTLQACLDHVAKFVPNAPVPALWGPPVDVAPDATLLSRILAITGRSLRNGA